jgi:hypothetical protein
MISCLSGDLYVKRVIRSFYYSITYVYDHNLNYIHSVIVDFLDLHMGERSNFDVTASSGTPKAKKWVDGG